MNSQLHAGVVRLGALADGRQLLQEEERKLRTTRRVDVALDGEGAEDELPPEAKPTTSGRSLDLGGRCLRVDADLVGRDLNVLEVGQDTQS